MGLGLPLLVVVVNAIDPALQGLEQLPLIRRPPVRPRPRLLPLLSLLRFLLPIPLLPLPLPRTLPLATAARRRLAALLLPLLLQRRGGQEHRPQPVQVLPMEEQFPNDRINCPAQRPGPWHLVVRRLLKVAPQRKERAKEAVQEQREGLALALCCMQHTACAWVAWIEIASAKPKASPISLKKETYRLLRLHERQILQGQRPQRRAPLGVGPGKQRVDHRGGHQLQGAVRGHLREADGVDVGTAVLCWGCRWMDAWMRGLGSGTGGRGYAMYIFVNSTYTVHESSGGYVSPVSAATARTAACTVASAGPPPSSANTVAAAVWKSPNADACGREMASDGCWAAVPTAVVSVALRGIWGFNARSQAHQTRASRAAAGSAAAGGGDCAAAGGLDDEAASSSSFLLLPWGGTTSTPTAHCSTSRAPCWSVPAFLLLDVPTSASAAARHSGVTE